MKRLPYYFFQGLQSLVKYFTWFCEHPGISKEALSSMSAMQSEILPYGNRLPDSYESALGVIEPYLVTSDVYDVCPNDCVIFRGEFESLSECPKCGGKSYISERSKTAVRRFTYLPLKPRLQRMFGNTRMAEILQSHATVQHSAHHSMHYIQDSPCWQNAYSNCGVFGGDRRGISLALFTDGVNPFSHNKVVYSMWPIMLTLLDLPRKIRNHFGSILMVGILPSNKSQEPRSLNPYLEIMVDEMLELSSTIMQILLHVLDYPGIGKVLSVVGSDGINGCMFCEINGLHNEEVRKTVYLDNRRFLSDASLLRRHRKVGS